MSNEKYLMLFQENSLKKFEVDVNAKGNDDWTPLHITVVKNAKEVDALLLNGKFEVDVNAQTTVNRPQSHTTHTHTTRPVQVSQTIYPSRKTS